MGAEIKANQIGRISTDVVMGVSRMCKNTLSERPKSLIYKVESDHSFAPVIAQLKDVLVEAKIKHDSLQGRGSGMFWMALGNIEDLDARYLFGAVLANRAIETDRETSEYLSEVGPQLLAMTSELGGPNSIEPRDKYDSFMQSVTMPILVESILTEKLKLEKTS